MLIDGQRLADWSYAGRHSRAEVCVSTLSSSIRSHLAFCSRNFVPL